MGVYIIIFHCMRVCHSPNKENNLKRIIRVGSQPQELWEMNQFDYNDKISLFETIQDVM